MRFLQSIELRERIGFAELVYSVPRCLRRGKRAQYK